MARILYLDDEEPLVFLFSRMLELLGHSTAAFTSARDAIAAFQSEPGSFDLILTDLSMPVVSGIEFARQILASKSDATVVVLTGHANPADVEAARQAGVLDVVPKPSTLEQMEQTVNDLLRRARQG